MKSLPNMARPQTLSSSPAVLNETMRASLRDGDAILALGIFHCTAPPYTSVPFPLSLLNPYNLRQDEKLPKMSLEVSNFGAPVLLVLV